MRNTSLVLFAAIAACFAGARGHAQIPPDSAPAVEQLVAMLEPVGNRSAAWSATARLQKLGEPATAALVARLRHDTFRDDHGNHSPVMEALEKIGPPAARALDGALTLPVLRSADAADVDFVSRATAVLHRIGIQETASILARIVRFSASSEARASAGRALLGQWPPRSTLIWIGESCLGRHWSACPFDREAPLAARALTPLLTALRDQLATEPDEASQLAIAAVVVRWGDGAVRRAGEQKLMSLVSSGAPGLEREAIELLGALDVREAAASIRDRAVTATSDDLRRVCAAALERLRDPSYVPLVASLMGREDPLARQYYTQEDIAFDSNAPADVRRAAYEAWQRWWDANGSTFVVNVRAARIDLECCRV